MIPKDKFPPIDIPKKYPLAYTQRFDIIDARLDELDRRNLNDLAVLQDENTGTVTLQVINHKGEVISQSTITVTQKILKSVDFNSETDILTLTCLDNSQFTVELSDILTLKETVGTLSGRVDVVEETLPYKADLRGGTVPTSQLPRSVFDVIDIGTSTGDTTKGHWHNIDSELVPVAARSTFESITTLADLNQLFGLSIPASGQNVRLLCYVYTDVVKPYGREAKAATIYASVYPSGTVGVLTNPEYQLTLEEGKIYVNVDNDKIYHFARTSIYKDGSTTTYLNPFVELSRSSDPVYSAGTSLHVNEIRSGTTRISSVTDGVNTVSITDDRLPAAVVADEGKAVMVNDQGQYILTEIQTDSIINVTWAELKDLRDSLELKPGVLYRITDYVTTTAQANTSSAGRQFDIVVTAVSDRQLSEEATALKHRRSGYIDPLSFCNISAWQIRYCLDNDTNRFAWADTTNGKGVVYYMKDEFGNEAYYDFKNIMFTKSGQYTNAYTFSYPHVEQGVSSFEEATSTDPDLGNLVYFNRILPSSTSNALSLPFNVFIGVSDYAMYHGNVLMDGCTDNRLEHNCNRNVLGPYCSGNRFSQNCEENSLGASCFSNILGVECCYNSIGCGSQSNSIDDYGYGNELGNHVFWCFVGAESIHNHIGNGCYSVRIGAYATNVNIGNGCQFVKFDDGTGDDMYYCRNNVVDPGCEYLTITCSDDDESNDNPMQNVHIHSGISGTQSSPKTITVPDRNLPYTINYYAPGSTDIILDD